MHTFRWKCLPNRWQCLLIRWQCLLIRWKCLPNRWQCFSSFCESFAAELTPFTCSMASSGLEIEAVNNKNGKWTTIIFFVKIISSFGFIQLYVFDIWAQCCMSHVYAMFILRTLRSLAEIYRINNCFLIYRKHLKQYA